MKKILLKDIVIPRGTIFDTSPISTQRIENGHIDCNIGLTDNSCGSFEYFFDKDDLELAEWFEDI